MKIISGFKTEDEVEVLMDRFEDRVTHVSRVDLIIKLEYALSLQFVDRLKKSEKNYIGEN